MGATAKVDVLIRVDVRVDHALTAGPSKTARSAADHARHALPEVTCAPNVLAR